MLADIQEAFRKAVLDPATAMPRGLAAYNGVPPSRRFDDHEHPAVHAAVEVRVVRRKV